MIFNVLSILLPIFTTEYFTYAHYNSYYSSAPALLFFLLAAGVVLSLFFTVFQKGARRKIFFPFFLFIPYLSLYSVTYNAIFTLFAFVLSIVLSLLLPKKKYYTKILFTDDNNLFYIKYTLRKTKKQLFTRMTNIFACFVFLIYLAGFIFTIPNPVWLIRAFPIDLSQKELPKGEVIASGVVSNAYWYDENSLLVTATYDIKDENGGVFSPCKEAGLLPFDFIVKINSRPAYTSDLIKSGISDGTPVTLTVNRRVKDSSLKEIDLTVTPIYSPQEDRYLIGMMYYPVKDIHYSANAALVTSVQTVAFAYPDTGYFAATAHSSEDVYKDIDSLSAHITSSFVFGTSKEGIMTAPFEYIGDIHFTNNYGSFGKLNHTYGNTLPIATKSKVHPGKATLLATLNGTTPVEYEVYITGTYRIDSRDVFCLIGTDERLKESGGITYGMSGSPIIQDGVLVGALSNTDSGGYCGYATYAYDMAHQIYKNKEKFR